MDADAKQALLDLQRDDGRVHPIDVVRAARDEDNPLHEHFEWDDGEAAEQYRLIQARALIARYVVVHEVAPDQQVRVRQLIALRSDKGGYRQLEDIAASPPLRESLLSQLAADLASVRARYAAFERVLRLPELFKAIDRVIAKAKRRKGPVRVRGKEKRVAA